MKKLLTLASILLLSGCVTYYYPEVALEDGVYYAEDDPSYIVDSGGYVAYSSYYPWSSLDYFYMGHYSYPRYGYGYYGGFSVGIGYSYSPWYVWHAPYYHYPHYYAWQPYYGYGHGRYGHGNKHNNRKGNKRKGHKNKYRNDNDYRYAGRGDNQRGNRRGEYSDDVRSPAGRNKGQSNSDGKQADSVNRYVSTAPSGDSGSRGMEVRSRGSKSTGKSRKQPVMGGAVVNREFNTSNKSVTKSSYRSRRTTGSAGETRYRAGAKQSRARTQPVESGMKSQKYAIVESPAQSTQTKGKSGHTAPVNSSGRSSARAPSGNASARSPSRSNSQSSASAKTHQSSGSSRRSQSSSASSGSRQSRQSNSSQRQNRK